MTVCLSDLWPQAVCPPGISLGIANSDKQGSLESTASGPLLPYTITILKTRQAPCAISQSALSIRLSISPDPERTLCYAKHLFPTELCFPGGHTATTHFAFHRFRKWKGQLIRFARLCGVPTESRALVILPEGTDT